MTESFIAGRTRTAHANQAISAVGGLILRLGLIIPLAWIGIQKFTSEEADAIAPLIVHQPLMSWLYDFVSAQALSNVLGSVEILAAVLIAVRPLSALAAAIGSGVATLLFASTVSLIKDVALLGAAVWSLGEALSAHGRVAATRGRTPAG